MPTVLRASKPEGLPVRLQDVIDGFQHLLGKFVFFHAEAWTWGFAKPQDGALIGQAGELFDLCELTVQRCIDKRFLHCRV